MMGFLVSLVIGFILGLLGGPVWILVPWGLAGLAIGYLTKDYDQAAVNGAVFGFSAAFFFMVFGYKGTQSLISRVPFFAALGLVGAVCGLVLGLAGRVARRPFASRQK